MPKYTLEQLQTTRQILVDYGYANSVARIDIEIEKAKRSQEERDFLEQYAKFLDDKRYDLLTPDELSDETLDYLKRLYGFLKAEPAAAPDTIKKSYKLVTDAPELLLLVDNEGDFWFRVGDETYWRSSNSTGRFTWLEDDVEFAPYIPQGWVPDGTTFQDIKTESEKTVKNNNGFDSMYIV